MSRKFTIEPDPYTVYRKMSFRTEIKLVTRRQNSTLKWLVTHMTKYESFV